MLRWFGVSPADYRNLKVIEGSIDEDKFGLPPHAYADLQRDTDEIFHCAANTSFAERNREAVERSNLQCLNNVIELAAGSSCYFFHYLGTAYSAGSVLGKIVEAYLPNTRFTNIYEETKHKAEGLVRDRCRALDIRLNIYRPSIVYGDSQTGRSIRFNALYYPLKLISTLKGIYARDIEENGGKAAAKLGVHRKPDGRMALPLRIKGNDHGGLNLIPIDYFVKACLAIWQDSIEGDIFHIVNNKTISLKEIISYVQEYFCLSGIEAISESDYERITINPLENLTNSYLALYHPYMQDKRVFENKKAKAILSKHGIDCPRFDYEIFQRIVQYAVSVKWGKALFS
jgi:nucleoside-diphosphate-sugar epimerase